MIRFIISKRINKYIINNFEKINSNMLLNGKTYFNHKCHLNAVQESLNKGSAVFMVACIDKNSKLPIIHFINRNKKGLFYDNTLGWYGKQNDDYYLIREISKDELFEVTKILTATKIEFLTKAVGFLGYILNEDKYI